MPVLLVHGLHTTSQVWTDVMADLGRHVLALAPDLAGMGRSERVPGRLDLATQARLLRALIRVTGPSRVLVAGHGIGGAVAVHLAALAPREVAGLALVAAPVHEDAWPTPADLRLLLPRVRAAAPARAIAKAVDMAGVEAAWRTVIAAPPPALVVWGDRDTTLHPSYGRRVAGDMPGSVWVPVADAGHMLPVERPERVAEELAAFAAEVRNEQQAQ